jgi:transposase
VINAEPDYKLLYEQSLNKLAEIERKYQQEVHLLTLDNQELRRKLFGIKRDNRTVVLAEGQLEMFTLEAPQDAVNASEALLKEELSKENQRQEIAAEKRKKAARSTSRMILPETLEREEQVIDPEGDLTNYKIIGEEVTEVLVLVPASFKVKRIVRRKWALKDADQEGKGVLIAPIPSRTVKRGLFDESLLSFLTISKYIDHLPLYRLKKIFEREGIEIPPSTLSDNIAAVSQALLPIYNALKREVVASLYIQADETPIKVLESEKKGACHMGYYWAYHSPGNELVLFDYQKGRGQDGPKKLFANFRGVVQSDGYQVYQALFKNNSNINQIFCMAHIRRKFDEASAYDQERSQYVLKEIGKIYAVEKQIRESDQKLSETQIVEIRYAQVMPVMIQLKEWMLQQYSKALPQSPIGKALAYALGLWDNMKYYCLHGHLQVDNNAVENAIRPIALGRKNYLFAGSHDAAQNAAILYSLFATCKKHQINPEKWLTDILQKINDITYEGKFSDLLPHRWKKSSL